ncbi:hypothetical protein SERLADRAFT_404789 [Serpula lacrymans var. lacrymans S7.9]|uniref:Uncharacterized protein n=1 Tax=Serpula lacrymans var. lacrymans (strain S7.9) TaxID=578457 RepID=F8NF03_SERL9|nr:uncharacterized protein SERLADRAFT_404789 [Serpula lacrymans var. lacrymans S7.9]EGO30762.1 hypothetical protein SERLADRAFT_404789 [Serpula lacrymans var. lacrymans S7.9]
MPVPADPADSSDRNVAETLEWACFKQKVYHKVLGVVFKTVQKQAHYGEAIKCSDKCDRSVHTGVPVKSLDREESCAVTATCITLASYPCTKCLVHHDKLHNTNGTFEAHIAKAMQQAYIASTQAGDFNGSMRDASHWHNLKHFTNVTTVDYADSQVFFDISKLLPEDCSLVHYEQLQQIDSIILDYKNACKQHFVNHVIKDIQQKGTTDNYETGIGEGIHQEIWQPYKQTYCKNADPQMARIDKNQEAIAYIQMLLTSMTRPANSKMPIQRDLIQKTNTTENLSGDFFLQMFQKPVLAINLLIFENTTAYTSGISHKRTALKATTS